MLKQLLATAGICLLAMSAQAADLTSPMTSPEASSAMPFQWSGAYAGADIGYGLLDGDFSALGSTVSQDFNGATLGGFVGYNWQLSNGFVTGIEGDVSYNWNDEAFSDVEAGTEWAGSVRGRLGFAFDRALVYGAAGWTATRGFAKDVPSGEEVSKTFSGWTIGAGLEYAVTDTVFLRGEYRYNDFGDKDIDVGPGILNVDLNQSVVKVGLGVKF
jgi:outer membrane immunogenic protein